eukprot:7618332-Pyramimonas_sp.AAC.1
MIGPSVGIYYPRREPPEPTEAESIAHLRDIGKLAAGVGQGYLTFEMHNHPGVRNANFLAKWPGLQVGLHAAVKPLLSRSVTGKFNAPPKYIYGGRKSELPRLRDRARCLLSAAEGAAVEQRVGGDEGLGEDAAPHARGPLPQQAAGGASCVDI